MAGCFAENVPRWLAGERFIKIHELLAEWKAVLLGPVNESGDNKRNREYHGSQCLDKAKVRIGERTCEQN